MNKDDTLYNTDDRVLKINNEIIELVKKTISGKGDSDKHLATFFSIALGQGLKNILELGVRNGDTTLPLLLAAYINNGKVTSVDLNQTNFTPDPKLKKHWNFVKQDAIQFLESVDIKDKFDLVYLDDWHAYDHVKRELELLDKLIHPGSIILVHDLMYGRTEPYYHADLSVKKGQWAKGGPYRAICELDDNFWEFATLPYNNGLTILRKKYSSKY
tara:strand:- start:1042 stop:1686 length:645 start_codon:yes stop_codon:yes gene_type:complete